MTAATGRRRSYHGKNTSADNGANAKRGKLDGAQSAFELAFRLLRVRQQLP
jgi:hypothetical protein